MVEEAGQPDDVAAMMENLWGPRAHPVDEPSVAAARTPGPGLSEDNGQTPADSAAGERAAVEGRLAALEARVEQLQAALYSQAARTDAALARANEVGDAVAGIARITKIWTGRRKP